MDNIFRARKRKSIDEDSIDSIRREAAKLNNLKEAVEKIEKDCSIHSEEFMKEAGIDELMKVKIMASKIKDRQEINEKIKILLYHLSLLKTVKLTKDYNAAKRCISQFMSNDFTKISAVLDDIAGLKRDITELEKSYNEVFTNYPGTLDFKMEEEIPCRKLIELLEKNAEKQVMITAAIGKSFVKEAKPIISDGNYRDKLIGR